MGSRSHLEEDLEAPERKRSKPRSSKQREAQARLANLEEERKRKKFWEDFRRREERFQRCQSSGKDYKATRSNFFVQSLSKGFGSQGREAHMRRAVLGSTDGFSLGLGKSHGQPVPEKTLRRAFSEIDVDGDGLISVRALTRALRRCGVNASKTTVERILQDCGYDTGQLTCEQFIRFFRATEHLVWSVDDEYNPVDNCCTRLLRFLLFLLLVAVLVLCIMLIRMEPYTEIWLGLLIAFAAVVVCSIALMIPVICIPVRRAWKLGQQRRQREQEAINAIRAREAHPQPAAEAKGPNKGLVTWVEDFYQGQAARGRPEPSVADLATQAEAYNPERYWVAQDLARVPRQGGVRPAWAGALSTEALEDDRRKRQPEIWQPQPHQVPLQQPHLQSTMELLERELSPTGAKDRREVKKKPSDLIMTEM